MEWLLICLCCVPALLFVMGCCYVMDYNQNKDGYNVYNSTLGVQCDADEKCDDRFTTRCTYCQHNCGMKEKRSSYKPKY